MRYYNPAHRAAAEAMAAALGVGGPDAPGGPDGHRGRHRRSSVGTSPPGAARERAEVAPRPARVEDPADAPAPSQLAAAAARAADAKLGRDTVVIEVGDVLAITDFFVITSGANDRQVRTIVEEVERQVVADAFGPAAKPRRIEGLDALRWVLMDYGSFVVHVFDEETRQFYDLERLWRDMPRLEWRTLDACGRSSGLRSADRLRSPL